MMDNREMVQIFADKLSKTGSMDEALVKAVWMAYNKGLSDAHNSPIMPEQHFKPRTKGFDDWFHEIENFGLRSERFYEDYLSHQPDDRLIDWLKAAFQAGVNSQH